MLINTRKLEMVSAEVSALSALLASVTPFITQQVLSWCSKCEIWMQIINGVKGLSENTCIEDDIKELPRIELHWHYYIMSYFHVQGKVTVGYRVI